MNRVKNILCFLFLKSFLALTFLFPKNMSAQFYQARNFNAENGLPSPEVYGMLQDSKGFMWFATDMGVSCYNGYEFKNYSTENGLPDNTVFGFFEDKKGRIWFRSFSGKLSYFLNDSIYVTDCNKRLEEEVRKKTIIMSSLYVDEKDTIWIGTSEKLVLKIAPGWQEKNVVWLHIPEPGAYLFLINSKDLVFGGSTCENFVINVYNKSVAQVARLNTGKKIPGAAKRRYFGRRLKTGNFLASIDQEMFEFNATGLVRNFELSAVIIEMIEDVDKRIICASTNGISFHNTDNFAAAEFIPGFSNKNATSVLIDKENALWISAEGHGVYYIPFRNARYYTTEHGLPQSKISCIAEKNGYIFTGHLNGSLSLIRANEIKNIGIFSQKFISRSSNRLNIIKPIGKAAVFVANSFNVARLEGANFEKVFIQSKRGTKKIILRKDSSIWLTQDRRILMHESIEDSKLKKEILFNQYIDDIFEDSKGILWIAGLNGLWNYHNDSLRYLGEQNMLLRERIVHILEDNKGRLWMATRGAGVVVKDKGRFFQVRQSEGLASNMCRSMFIDSNNVVWVGSNNGLSRIQVIPGTGAADLKFSVEVYSNKNGLLTNEVNYIVKRNHELLITHNSGISIFDPGSFKQNSFPPPIYFTGAEINSKTYKDDSLRLDFSRNYLKINYVGLSYKNPGSLQYKYRMEGLDTSWVYTTYTSAQFQTLDPGEYIFSVYAKNDDGYWSAGPAVLRITIVPAWWQTWWFRLCTLLLLTGIIYFLVKKRIRKIQKREQEKSRLQNKVAAAELKALRAQMNPHFVFNAINSVQHFITSNDPDSSQRYLSKFAKLIRYVVDNSKPTAIPLAKELEAIRLYMDIEALRFEDHFDYEINVDPKIDQDFVHIPSMLIQPYVENAIWHGLMHKKGPGNISISVQLAGDVLKCSIQDNGVGRKKSFEFKSATEMKSHTSVGMTITQERLEIINALNASRLSVEVIDLFDKNGNAVGTRVDLFIPSN